ncbi:YfgM family protein [Ectothiorhodospira lacustris]|uniref:YfgM family protein n=1 Tax=Ectothiorhodospira lacustris TaxID=2899127 RepID=UPI001EE8F9DF|nr:tetratricopeptide repeat protein [Ectothiorhodospira lacustris]MCG5499790.1 tetratricopeptide repeat protein [Ectothiorhodospira lacustris]MCG5510509.1 tetratricopeptide repeat protein [Ectothiorhodospira lacustris]MCG5522255.1 tetratricopeptide repeat protein [Ectothiorhodospira lacustris]
MSYATDEERVEAIKRWWKENGTAVILGLVVGLGGIVGWRLWTGHVDSRAVEASEIYMAMVSAARQGGEIAHNHGTTLMEGYRKTPYAALAALELARLAVERDDLVQAEGRLRWAMEHARTPETAQVARTRLARVLIADDRAQDALKLLEDPVPEGFMAVVEELRGDAYHALNDQARARAAYDRAMLISGGLSDYLQMKRDALNVPAQVGDS